MMQMILTEEQELLRDSVASFAQDKCDVGQLRALRNQMTGPGFDEALWKDAAELGWLGIPFSEDYGGLGLGYAELGIVLEELGKKLVNLPILSSIVMGGGAIARGGTEALKTALLPGICDGSVLSTLAYQETNRHNPYFVETSAEMIDDTWVLSGRKVLVLDGTDADHIVLLARSSNGATDRDGLSLFVVPCDANGLVRKRNILLDSRVAATIELDNVKVGATTLLGRADEAADIVDLVLAQSAIALSAEMLGGIQQAFDTTLEYLKLREQFGAKIGSFQALKHRAARWFCELELTRSIVMKALRAIDEGSDDLVQLASVCKARASSAFHQSGKEGIQMHGGIGVTDEMDIGFFFKRARVTEMLLGDAGFHRNAYAALSAY